MSSQRGMFSESWHRVAGEVVRLSPAVEVRKQVFRGETWYLLHDRLHHEFFRLRPAAWAFVGRLRGDRTVEEVWKECLELYPEEAPGQEEVIGLLSQLYQSNLFQSSFAPDSTLLFERFRKKRRKQVQGQLMNFLFIHLPLFDPDRLLNALRPLGRVLFGWPGFLVWLGVVGMGLKVAAENFGALADQSALVIAPSNLPWLYLCMVFIKLFHELGHGMACKRFDGGVHTCGVMLMIFNPMPYVDASASWAFRPRRQRLLVDAAGMLVEFFIAGIAAMVWVRSDGGLVGQLAYNVMFIASVSTILFNANPLLRFDGYYILSDWFDLPNLYGRATQQLKHLCEYYLFGIEDSFSPASSARETAWLNIYGVTSLMYRIFLLVFIVFMVSGRFLGLGLLLALICGILFFLVPLGKLIRYLCFSERLARRRRRAWLVTGGAIAVVAAVLATWPAPRHLRAPGVIQAAHHATVFTPADGFVVEILAGSTQQVEKDQPLIRLINPELDLEIEALETRMQQLLTRADQVRQENQLALLEPLQRENETLRYLHREFLRRREALIIRAPAAGTWSSPQITEMPGTWVPRGTELGQVVDETSFSFTAVVSQEDSAFLFNETDTSAEVRLIGEADRSIPVATHRVLPAEQSTLPSAALGWLSGGSIEVRDDDPSGRKALEGFFQVEAELGEFDDVHALHLRSGQIRFTLPPEPLLQQGMRRVRQFLRKKV